MMYLLQITSLSLKLAFLLESVSFHGKFNTQVDNARLHVQNRALTQATGASPGNNWSCYLLIAPELA